MLYTEKKPPLVVIVGPTAVGKTEISIKLAEQFKAEIVSADSMQFYIGMDIGTAKPTLADRERIPHHLIDIVNPDEPMSLAVYQKAAQKAIRNIHKIGKLPILVGGTGQYIRAVIEDWSIPVQEPDYKLRTLLIRWGDEIGADGLHNRLAVLDPLSASRIDPRNLRRTVRALEVSLKTGIRFSDQRGKLDSRYDLLLLGLKCERNELYIRIDTRIESMLTKGFIDEVDNLLMKGYSPDLPAFSAIGYREIIEYLNEEISLQEAVVVIKKRTRQFVRRQANWFKENDPGIKWFETRDETINSMVEAIEYFNNSRL
jgi:tRNA dimethylallyltransferase